MWYKISSRENLLMSSRTVVKEKTNLNPKYVFLCGLHRSGTTVLAKCIGQFDDSTGLEDTGVAMDEGQFVQSVYSSDDQLGGVGMFAFHPSAHLTDKSSLLTEENCRSIHTSWEAYWDMTQVIRVEKSPSNILRMRFLQEAFDNACFIVITRHPIAVTLASQKWSFRSYDQLLSHWVHGHRIYCGDKECIDRLYELSYEELVRTPGRKLNEIAAFLETDYPEHLGDQIRDANTHYLEKWQALSNHPIVGGYYRYLEKKYDPATRALGYPLRGKEGEQLCGIERLGPIISVVVAMKWAVVRPINKLRYRINKRRDQYFASEAD